MKQGDSGDDEPNARVRGRDAREGTTADREELDSSNLIGADEAAKRFRKAERKRTSASRVILSTLTLGPPRSCQ